jgi:hypothetical protein
MPHHRHCGPFPSAAAISAAAGRQTTSKLHYNTPFLVIAPALAELRLWWPLVHARASFSVVGYTARRSCLLEGNKAVLWLHIVHTGEDLSDAG